jgi:hypothetical protein
MSNLEFGLHNPSENIEQLFLLPGQGISLLWSLGNGIPRF